MPKTLYVKHKYDEDWGATLVAYLDPRYPGEAYWLITRSNTEKLELNAAEADAYIALLKKIKKASKKENS